MGTSESSETSGLGLDGLVREEKNPDASVLEVVALGVHGMTSVGSKVDGVWVEGVHLWNDGQSCVTSGLRGVTGSRRRRCRLRRCAQVAGPCRRKCTSVLICTPGGKKAVVNRAGHRTSLAETNVNDSLMGATASVRTVHF